jgi:DNA-binding GntR family transcriptional regulator
MIIIGREGYYSQMAGRPASRSNLKKQELKAPAGNLRALAARHANAGTAAEMAHAVLREAILSNILPPGARLRADELAKELTVSKTPVREALRKLQAEDLIVSAGNALTVKVLSERQLLEIYYTREALEGMAARLAAENAGAADLTTLRAILHDIEAAQARSNVADLRHYTGEFQLAAFKASHNDYLYGLLRSIQEKIRTYRMTTTTLPGRDEEIVTYCRSLLRAIETRDPDEAEQVTRANRRRTLELRLTMMRSARPPAQA